jgi:hypothetical protein
MATPMTADEIISQLQKWQVTFRPLKGWATHERDDETGLIFGPVFGFIVHHTGDDAPDDVDRNIIWNGRAGLPGPLAHFGLNDDGVLDLHSAGRANHAGGGDPAVLKQVIHESYEKYPRPPKFHTGSPGAIDGNDLFYGVEVYYSGKQKMTRKAYKTLVRLGAAICDFHGWTSKSIIGHKEWSDWKSDPASQDMHQLRLDVAALLESGLSPKADTRVTKIGGILDEALALFEQVPESRKLVSDIGSKIEIQRARLPER